MKQLSLLLGVGLFVAGAALPVAAQQGEGGASLSSVQHAELGLLEAVGTYTHRIVIALPGETSAADKTYQSYDTNDQTMVEGMGSMMEVTDALSEDLGHVVVVTYEDRGEHFLATHLDFAPDEIIHETRGTIQSIDPGIRTMMIKNADGTQRIDLGSGPGAAIDTDQGLIKPSALRVGQHVTVDYGSDDVAYIVRVE